MRLLLFRRVKPSTPECFNTWSLVHSTTACSMSMSSFSNKLLTWSILLFSLYVVRGSNSIGWSEGSAFGESHHHWVFPRIWINSTIKTGYKEKWRNYSSIIGADLTRTNHHFHSRLSESWSRFSDRTTLLPNDKQGYLNSISTAGIQYTLFKDSGLTKDKR